MRGVDLIFEAKPLEFEFNGRKIRGNCELETKNTLIVHGKIYPKRSIRNLEVGGRRKSKVCYERSLEERLKRLLAK
ncbi:MAG: hypothetical protein ACP5GO_03565 [Thermoprotei archaeon]|jgi:hypothetical protein